MPPSPAVRVFPRREMTVENHKRGRSLESGIHYRDDDDLALFNESRSKEKENFLLQSNDDFEEIFSTKLRYLPDHKLGISIPARGESSDLLNTEGDKNDYDWLITPPETPLFTSLDDDAPPINLAPRGRSRSQPVPVPLSSSTEKGCTNSRGSASPQRLSPSPQSSNNTLQSRSRPLSATHSSPPPTLRQPSALRRLSSPPSKPKPALRSSTPSPRRMSTGSVNGVSPSGVRGASPIKTSRGNSASPKISTWQSNIPGFSSEAPPNLRTSLADRPASYVRGTSPASRNSSRSGRQSMSPTASRSVSSSHSHDRDPFSVHSKASVASSGDDDAESPQSLPISSSDRSAPRSIGTLPNMRTVGYSKKPSKILYSSAPKRSFDLALRQMDKKGPQNMFRPLLSSVPSSTFASVHHRSLTSRNSSITTSSNASSDQGMSGALDTREIELNQEDLTRESVKAQYLNLQDEIFSMDQADALNEDFGNKIMKESTLSQHDGPSIVNSRFGVADRNSQLDKAAAMDDYSNGDGPPDMAICSKCGLKFPSDEDVMEGYLQFCAKCANLEINTRHSSLEILDQSTPEPLKATCSGNIVIDYLDEVTAEGQDSYSEPSQNPAALLVEEGITTSATDQEIIHQLYGDFGHQQLQHGGANLNSKVEVPEGAGISLLLKKSSSSRGPIVQSRSFTASTTCCDDFSYMRDSMNSIRSSIGHISASVSSSVDMGYSRKIETRVQRQSSGRKSDTENWMLDMPTKHKQSASSLSGASSHCFQVQSAASSCHEDSIGAVKCVDPSEQSLASEYMDSQSHIFKSAAELTDHLMNVHSEDISVLPVSISDSNNSMDADTLSAHSQPCGHGEGEMQSPCPVVVDVEEAHTPSSLDTKPEMEIDSADIVAADCHSDVDSNNSHTDELLEPSDSVAQNNVITTLEEFYISDSARGAPEESTIMVEDSDGRKSRSLTLEEATDAILFCSSIVHNLAYEAVNIAIDKETPRVEPVLQPEIPFVAKSNSDRPEIRSRNTGNRNSRSQKTRQKKLETDPKPASIDAETEAKFIPHVVKSPYKWDSMKPPKLESKCNCTIM
ncbi:uncharacterized protein LOC142533712 [Primulina tabacum]|uniref:uncharacterized protein LOC142533712 n=1 Tax=Primulina tabacum TaxID=48773 RepID=UPI003F596653